jgi:hypothetical protein
MFFCLPGECDKWANGPCGVKVEVGELREEKKFLRRGGKACFYKSCGRAVNIEWNG